MKILVTIKRAVHPKCQVWLNSDSSGVELDGLPMGINPFCKMAVEQAVQLKESSQANEVVVVSVGDKSVQEQLRDALAMGADRAIHIETAMSLEPIHIAVLLQKVVEEEAPDLVLMGKLSMDSDNAQTGAMLSSLLDIPLINCISSLSIEADHLVATCREDCGESKVLASYPAVVTTDLGLVKPRLVNLPDVMKAKRKPLIVRLASELETLLTRHCCIDAYQVPAGFDRKVLKCSSADELAQVVFDNVGK